MYSRIQNLKNEKFHALRGFASGGGGGEGGSATALEEVAGGGRARGRNQISCEISSPPPPPPLFDVLQREARCEANPFLSCSQ